MVELKSDVSKKRWWVAVVVVPIVIAVIGIVPSLIKKSDGTISVPGNQFNDEVYFNTVSVVLEQAKEAGQALSPEVVADLERAMAHVRAREFERAIPLLEAVSKEAALPAVINNLGAAHLALNQQSQAVRYFNEARGESASRKNLKVLEASRPSPTMQAASAAPGASLGVVPTQRAGVTAELIEFSRFQSTITVKVRLSNASEAAQTLHAVSRGSYLLDELRHEKYSLLAESNPNASDVPAGGSIVIWVKYDVPLEKQPQHLTVVLNHGIMFEHIQPS